MQKILFGAALLLAFVVSVHPAVAQDDEYRQQLMLMMEKSGSLDRADVIMKQLIPMLKQTSQAPAEFWDAFQTKWDQQIKQKLVDIYVPIYKKYLTLADLKTILAFYESPVGQKLAAVTPAMTQEGMQSGQKLGMEVATEMIQEMQQLGYR